MPKKRSALALAVIACAGLAFAAAPAPAVPTAPASTQAQSAEPSLAERLAWIDARLEEAREQQHVPGMALAIIKDGQVVALRGFGVADLETQREVTPDTRFAVGSTTKAFTATLIGMLSDDGKMSFDESVHEHLPQFHLNDPEADAQVTIRDLLCHRTGLAVLNVLWYSVPDITREEIIERVAKAELLNPFRSTWNYSNISFLAAGMAAGNAAGSDWDTAVRERILEPLGMTSTNTTYADAMADPLMSKGYLWDEDAQEQTHQPMRSADSVGPAGSINSSARDMARWVLFQLGRGEIDGTRLIAESTHAETWTKQIAMTSDVDYGLGWMLRTWEGRRVIEHAGGIDGFTAEIAMLPDDNLGFVLLMNQFGSLLQEQSRTIIFRGLTGSIAQTASAEDFSTFTGGYIANFGSLKNAELKVLVQNGNLAVDVPGQMVFELQPPDDQGRRAFKISDAVKVKFNENADGEVYSLTFFQSGMTFEAFRKGFEAPVEIDLAEAQACLGTYRFAEKNLDVTVVIQNNRLAVDHPGQMVYELTPPDSDGWCTFRVTDAIRVRFNRDSDGNVVSMSHQQNGAEITFERVADAASGPALPTVEEINQWLTDAGVVDRSGKLKSLRVSGTTRAVNMGLEGPMTGLYTRDGSMRTTTDFGRFGDTDTIIHGDDAVRLSSTSGREALEAGERAEALQGSPLQWTQDWSTSFGAARVTGTRSFDDRDCVVLSLGAGGDAPMTVFIDRQTHLPLAYESMLTSTLGPRLSTTTRLSDWREVEGVQVPFRSEMRIAMAGAVITQFDQVEPNVDVEPDVFEVPSEN